MMETKTIKKKEPRPWALPDNPISLDEFQAGICFGFLPGRIKSLSMSKNQVTQ